MHDHVSCYIQTFPRTTCPNMLPRGPGGPGVAFWKLAMWHNICARGGFANSSAEATAEYSFQSDLWPEPVRISISDVITEPVERFGAYLFIDYRHRCLLLLAGTSEIAIARFHTPPVPPPRRQSSLTIRCFEAFFTSLRILCSRTSTKKIVPRQSSTKSII